MTTQLYRAGQAAVTVRDPDVPIAKQRLHLSAQRRTLDGSLKQHIATSKWRWEPEWTLLTAAEYNTLITELDREQDLTWRPPDEGGTTYTVRVIGNSNVVVDEFGSRAVRAVLEET